MGTPRRVPAVRDTLRYWAGGIRLYIGLAAVLATFDLWWWAAAAYGGSELFAIRLEEVYAWLALGLLATAVAIGPLYGALPKLPGNAMMRDARRLFGVSTAWFASLHTGIAYVALFKAANPLDLPIVYQRAFAIGAVALLILLAMAFTSFDKAFYGMGKWWFRLHRFVYLAVICVLLHTFMIGTGGTDLTSLAPLAAAAAVILGLHGVVAFKKGKPTVWQLLTMGTTVVLLLAVFGFGFHEHFTSNPAESGGTGQQP